MAPLDNLNTSNGILQLKRPKSLKKKTQKNKNKKKRNKTKKHPLPFKQNNDNNKNQVLKSEKKFFFECHGVFSKLINLFLKEQKAVNLKL